MACTYKAVLGLILVYFKRFDNKKIFKFKNAILYNFILRNTKKYLKTKLK